MSTSATIAARFPSRFLQQYSLWKLRTDPAYEAIAEALRSRSRPVLDLGCGVGLLAHFLEAHGIRRTFVGRDFDGRKIELARAAGAGLSDATFEVGDVRGTVPPGCDVVLLDVLHYFSEADRQMIFASLRDAVQSGALILIRSGVRDRSWRYRLQWSADAAARVVRWMRAERLHYPSRDEILAAFPGCRVEVQRLSGRTPFNNFLFRVSAE